ELRSFLMFTNFYRRFIEGYSKLVAPLFDSINGGGPFRFTEKQREVFNEVKNRFLNSQALLIPDFEKPFYVNADASDHSMGMVLSQMVDGKLQPVAFDSR